jgi:hypothetical protein
MVWSARVYKITAGSLEHEITVGELEIILENIRLNPESPLLKLGLEQDRPGRYSGLVPTY